MTNPTRPTLYMPFVQFLADANGEDVTDESLTELMDRIADTLGDMLGHQSDRYAAVEHFVARLQAAADAAAQTQVMSKQ